MQLHRVKHWKLRMAKLFHYKALEKAIYNEKTQTEQPKHVAGPTRPISCETFDAFEK